MNAYVTASQATATSWQGTVDGNMGYPKAGVDIGGGVHAPPDQSVTTTYAVPFKHPVLSQWAYLSDAVTDGVLIARNGVPAPAQLAQGWFPVATGIML